MSTKKRSMKEVIKKLNDFAIRHKVILQENGTCGFGRPCVGFELSDCYIDFNPNDCEDKIPKNKKTREGYIKEFYCEDFFAPKGVEAYHKHDCLAVLFYEESGREEALRQLLQWIENIESKHKVEIVKVENKFNNIIESMLKGLYTPRLKLKK